MLKLASLKAPLPPTETRCFLDFTRAIPDEQLHEKGREMEPHVTVLWGFLGDDPKPIADLLRGRGPIRLKLGKMSLFQRAAFDVLKVDVDSVDLHALNSLLRSTCACQNEFADYHPHLTLAFLKPGSGPGCVVQELFAGKEYSLSALDWSPGSRERFDRTVIYLDNAAGAVSTASGLVHPHAPATGSPAYPPPG